MFVFDSFLQHPGCAPGRHYMQRAPASMKRKIWIKSKFPIFDRPASLSMLLISFAISYYWGSAGQKNVSCLPSRCSRHPSVIEFGQTSGSINLTRQPAWVVAFRCI